MSVVYKYALEMGDTELKLPHYAVPLVAQVQAGQPQLWVKVPSIVFADEPQETWTVRIVGTGHVHHDLDDFDYLSTFQLFDGDFIGHVFVKHEL